MSSFVFNLIHITPNKQVRYTGYYTLGEKQKENILKIFWHLIIRESANMFFMENRNIEYSSEFYKSIPKKIHVILSEVQWAL